MGRVAKLELSEISSAGGSSPQHGASLGCSPRIVLALARGCQNTPVAVQLGTDAAAVSKWRRRFVEQRLDGLWDEPAGMSGILCAKP
jgi:hypothetical protein